MRLSRTVPPLVLGCTISILAAGAAQAQQQVGSFLVERKTDLITDEDRSYAAVQAQPETGEAPLSLVWWCLGDRLAIGFYLTPQYSSSGYVSELKGVWRFDQDEPEGISLARLNLMEPIFLLPEDYRHTFTTRARGASRLVVRATGLSTRPVDYVFSLGGAERALNTLACVRRLRPPADPPALLGRAAEEKMALPQIPLETRADTLRLFDHYTPDEMRDRRGEVAVRVPVLADGRIDIDGMQVTRTPHDDLNWPAMFIASHLTFPPGRARPVMVYVYFSPTGGHIQVDDPN
jgi:hypothetical protein